ncbi:MAG TPA: hypothetical protein VEV82_03170 [Actinomycetota bacterium]|nr:hypothetical protein [Actinomycetota bacterium]
MTKNMSSLSRLLRIGGFLLVSVAFVLAPAWAAQQAKTDPTDAPSGPEGKTDLRSIRWDVGASTTTLTVSVDESTYGFGQRAALGLHILVDADHNGLADADITGIRNSNGLSIDITPRVLDGTLSTLDCQDLAGSPTALTLTVNSQFANGRETFAFTLANGALPDGLSQSRWVAFGQSPEDTASAGPWDYLPDAANPDPTALNPGARTCAPGAGGLRSTMAQGFSLETHELSVSTTGTGSGAVSSSPGGIDCGSDCTEVYENGTSVTLTASPAGNSKFSGWSGSCSGSGTCQKTMNGERAVTALFKRRTTTTLNVSKSPGTLAAAGEISPAHHDISVLVRLLKEKNGAFVELDRKHPLLTSSSHYRASFARPSTGVCKITTRFSHADHVGSSAGRRFSC